MLKKQKRKTTRKNQNKEFLFPYLEELVIQSKQIEGVRSSTIRNYTKFFKQFEKCFGEVDVRELTENDAKDFVSFLIDSDLNNTTINSYLNCAKCSFQILEKEEISENIFRNIKRLKTDTKAIDILTVDEIRSFLKVMDQSKYNEFRDFVLIHVLIDSMGRLQECITLCESDFDFEKQTITFNNTKSRKARVVPVSKKTLKLVKELIRENEDFDDTTKIFLSVTGEPISKSAREMSTKLKVYAERAGIKKRVHFHLFRHSSASHFLAKSKNLRLLQILLGHSDISITQIYAHVLDQQIFDEVQEYSMVNNLELKKKIKRSNS